MFNPNPPKSSLHNLLSQTFFQEKRSRSTARSQQSDNNVSRLKNICFPRNDENNPNQTIDHPGFSIRQDHTRYPPARPRQRNTASSHINKSPNADKSSSFYFQDQTSFVAYNTSDVSFNMSPLSARHENQEVEHDTSAWFEGEKSDIMNRVRKDLMHTTMTPSKTPLKEISNIHQKSLATRDHVIELAQHFNSEMTRFVSTLMKSMKTVCLTKTSERSLQVLLEKYSGYLGGVQDEWDQNLHSEEDFTEITKNLVKTLGNCFAELLNKLSDLLHKLKNFKGIDFNPLSTKGVLSTLAIILQQDQTLTSHQALLQGLQILTQHTNGLVAMRLAYIFKSKIAAQKLHAFTSIKLHIARESIKQSEASSISAGSVLSNLMSRQYLKQLFSSFSHLKTNYISQTLKQEINTQENLKDLLTLLLKSAHNEPRFFEAINFFLTNLTKCGYCEFLLLDKSQHIAYGYPSQVSSPETIENKPLQSKRMYRSRDSSDKETLVTFYDSIPSTTREDEPMKYELSYDNESLLQYVISTKQALESWNLPHISLYNRDVDVPLGIKKNELKFSKFMYYPVCSKMGEKEVTAVVRLFLSEKEGPLDQSRIDSLQRFSQTMGPLFNTFISLIKRASELNTDRLMGGNIQEEVFKKLISGLVKMMNLSDTTDIFQTFSQLLFSLIYMEGFSIFQWNQDGSLGKLYSSDSHIISAKEQNLPESTRQLKTANSLQISIVDPSNGDLKGLIEIQRSKYEGVIIKGKRKDTTKDIEKFNVDSLPSTLTTLISTFGFHMIEKTKNLQGEEAERRALEGQVEEVKSINTLLGNRLNLHELLHEFTGKLQNCSSHTEVVLFFNEILQKSRVQIDLATLCFANSNNTGYFTYNHLYDEHLETLSKRSIVNYTEHLVSFSKVDSLLGSLLNSIAQGDQIIRINYEQHTRPEAGVLKLPLEQSERHKAIYLDLQDEDILSQFPIKTNDSFNEQQIPSPAQRCPKKMLLLPISDHNGNIVAHIVLGQSSNTKMFEKDEEFFAEKLGEILKDYLSSQQKLSNSLNEILREVEKNQANQSKIKAYRGLVLNQNLQPEYQLYKKHKNLQAFLSFLEATYCQLLKAQTSRILLYNDNSDSLYSYPKIQSSEIKEITHKLASSITGNCVLKNDYLIYPVPAASPYALSINDNAISPLASHRIATWRSKISNVGESSGPKKDLKLKTPFKERLQNLGGFAFHHQQEASGWPSSNRSQLFHTPGRPSSFLSHHPQYNPQVDHVDKIQFTKPIMKQSFGKSKIEGTASSSDMVSTFLCVPLCDDSKRVIGVLQLFNKSQPGKHFQTKDLIKVNAITEAMLPKLMKLINNPEKLSSKAFSTGLERITKTFNTYQTDITRDSFLSIKNIYMNHRKHKTRGLYVYAGLNLVSSIFNNNLKKYFDQVKLFDTITRYEALHLQSSRKERLAGLNNVMEKLAWKNKSSGFNSIKLSSYEDLSMLISSQYTRGGETFKGKGLLLGGDVSIQAKYFAKTLSGILQTKISSQKKSIFEDLRQHSNQQKALLLLDSQRSGPKSLKSFLSMLTSFIKRFYSEGFLQCNIALVDTMAEKAFWFNEKSSPEFHIGIKNRKQLKNFEKIVQQRLTHSSDAMSVFETDDGEEFEQISYIAIDLSDSPLFENTFDDPNLIIEVMYKGIESIEITENQKDQIQGLFVQGISNLRGTLNVMFNLQKKFSTNTKYKSFMKWMMLCKEQKNNEVIGQTHRAFQLVETQMATFEQDMKKYQEEIVAYDEKFKILTADLENKTEINTELNFKIEQLTVEKKAKTKCLALSMMFTHFSVNTSQQFRLRANFDKWRNMAKTARVTTNIVSKISQINNKHISARYRASLLILTHALQKCSHKVLMTSFKQLVASSVMLFTLQKSAIIPHSLSHNASLQDIREEVRSKTPEAATRKSLNNLKVPYLPLKRDTTSMHPVEREFWAEKKKEEDKEFNTTLHLELPSRLNISGFSQESNEGGIANHDRLVGTGSSIVARYGRKSSNGSRENLDHDTLSRSPKHLSFIQYRVNLMEKGSGKKKGKKPEMSERTVNFLKEFEANKYLNQRKNKNDALNKSDIASSTRKSKYNRDSANQTFHYNRPANSSFVTNENLGESFSLKNTEDFFKKSAK